MRYVFAGFALIGTVACAAPCLADSGGSFTLLNTASAVDVTIDEFGRTLVLTMDGSAMFIYETGALDYVGDGYGSAGLSADGFTVTSTAFNNEGVEEAARWGPSGFEFLGALPNALQCPSISNGYATSADGSAIVGLSWDGCSGRAFHWTAETGMQEMQSQGNGGNRASVVSHDGQVLAGFAQGNFARTPAVWTADGAAHPTFPFDADNTGEVGAITPDGETVAGVYNQEAFYWNETEGVVTLGWLEDDGNAHALGISEDGRTIVGFSGILLLTGYDAFIWTPQSGMQDMRDVLAEMGYQGIDDIVMSVATDVSEDGSTVVGWAYVMNADQEIEQHGWILTLPEPEPCAEDFDADGVVGFTDLTQLLGTWGPCAGCLEDLDGDGTVGFTDLTQLLGTWGPC